MLIVGVEYSIRNCLYFVQMVKLLVMIYQIVEKLQQDVKANYGSEESVGAKIQQHYHLKGDSIASQDLVHVTSSILVVQPMIEFVVQHVVEFVVESIVQPPLQLDIRSVVKSMVEPIVSQWCDYQCNLKFNLWCSNM